MYSEMMPIIVIHVAVALAVLVFVLSVIGEWLDTARFDGRQLECKGSTVVGGVRWSLVSCRYVRRVSDHARWLLVEFEACNISRKESEASTFALMAFQNGTDLDRDDDPYRCTFETPDLEFRLLLPGGRIRMAQMFRLRDNSPVTVSFDAGATTMTLPARSKRGR